MTQSIASFQRPPLQAERFTATRFATAADKAAFGNALLRFIAEDFPQHRFTQPFYGTLHLHFGMIAHYNRHGFWAEYFTCLAGKLRFLQDLTSYPCWGSPEHTWCDLERAVISRLRAAGLVERLAAARAREVEAAERALLNRLQARYQPEKAPVAETPASPPGSWASDQPSLF